MTAAAPGSTGSRSGRRAALPGVPGQRHLQAREGRGEEPVAALRLRRHRLLPKGQRLALAHYNGATLWYPNVAGEPQRLEWKGSHLGITVSADQRFVVTTMQEPQLHGWRLEDGQHMRMSGYPGKVRSFAWTQGGKFLATSGARAKPSLAFSGKNGPMGVNPTMIAPAAKAGIKVTQVAGHPRRRSSPRALQMVSSCSAGSRTARRS